MKVFFGSNNDKMFECSDPIEQRIYKSGVPAGWLLIFNISNTDVTSDNLMDVIGNGETEMTFVKDEKSTLTLTDYNTVISCTIRHRETGSVVEFQFKKEEKKGEQSDETNETTD